MPGSKTKRKPPISTALDTHNATTNGAGSTFGVTGLYIVLILMSIVMFFPFLVMLLTAFKPQHEIITFPPRLIPLDWSLENYQKVLTELPFGLLLRNSVIYSTTITVVSLFFDSMCAYALSRLTFRGREFIFLAILATLMVPTQVTLVPLFLNLYSLHWINTFQGLIVPHLSSAFGIFLLRQFFLSIPRELEDAARMDGAGEFRIYWQIVLPLSGPALATLFIFHFMYNWNDFLWPLIVTTSGEMRTLPTGLALFMGDHNVEYGVLLAGATIAAAPLIIAFLFAQKYFVAGIALTGLKE